MHSCPECGADCSCVPGEETLDEQVIAQLDEDPLDGICTHCDEDDDLDFGDDDEADEDDDDFDEEDF